MENPPKDKDQERGDDVLRRLLKTPPSHKVGKEREGDRRSDRPPVLDEDDKKD